jgi:hypothetical protein
MAGTFLVSMVGQSMTHWGNEATAGTDKRDHRLGMGWGGEEKWRSDTHRWPRPAVQT